MKLELRHLAPYLPYGLKMKWIEGDMIYKLTRLSTAGLACVDENGYRTPFDYEHIKPILRPLSDLSEKIEHEGKKFVPMNKLPRVGVYDVRDLECSYLDMQKLFEWHFNVFDLPQKLWVDINTIKEFNPKGE